MPKYEVKLLYAYPWVWLHKDGAPWFAVYNPQLSGNSPEDFNIFNIMMKQFDDTAKLTPMLIRNMRPNVLIYYTGKAITNAIKFQIPDQVDEVWARIKDTEYGPKFFGKIFGQK